MVEGKHLNHPQLEQGNCARMKILKVNPNKDIPIKTILFETLDLYKKGVIKIS